jgi:ABC-2 type transport system ATP-binding protein
MGEEPAIEASGLRKAYRGVDVLSDVGLRIACGSVFALLGPNGAGKTTMVRILTTLLRPDAGRARVAGFDVLHDRHRVRRAISLTGQYPSVDGGQTGEENLRMMGRLSGLPRRQARQRARELLAGFGLSHAAGRRVATYSGGMRRRLDLAAGFVTRPAVVFLDEPTTGLDLRSRQDTWKIIMDFAAAGVTVFLTTQYLEEADRMADRIAVLDGGRIVADGSPAGLKKQVSTERVDLTLTDPSAFADVTRALGTRVLRADRAALTVSVATDGSAAHVRTLLDEVDPRYTAVSGFTVHRATIDDVFLALTGRPPTRRPAAQEEGHRD